MNLDYYEIIIEDRSGNQTSLITSSVGIPPLISAEFAINRNGGCGAFRMDIHKDLLQGSISFGNLLTLKAKLTDGVLTTYYKGVVVSVPGATVHKVVRYEAEGLWYQAEHQTIIKYYEGADTDDVVKAILADIDTTNSDISTSQTEISIGSPYTIGDFEIERMTAAAAIRLLAEVQQDTQYGVDQNGKLYFKDLSTTDEVHYFVGTHLEDFNVASYTDKVVNRAYLDCKNIIGGGSLILARDDTTSSTKIATLGIRDAVVSVPHLDPADVWRYAENYLNTHGERNVCTARPTGFSNFVFPRGNARIVERDGTEHSLPILSVQYKLDPTAGLIGTMEIGDEPAPNLEDEMRELLQRVATINSNAISINKITHTGGEEWQQESIIDGQKLGLLNHYFKVFTDTKGLDDDQTAHVVFDNSRHFITGIMPEDGYGQSIYVSPLIPAGQQPATARIHAYCDLYGRINFDYDDDLVDNFTPSAANNWTIKADEPLIEYDCVTGGTLSWTGPTSFAWPNAFTFKVALRNFNRSTAATYNWIYWNYLDANNWCGIRIINDASYMRFQMRKMVAGVQTNEGTPAELLALKDADCELEIRARWAGPTSYMKLYHNDVYDAEITSTTMACTASRDLRLGSWICDGVTPLALCDVGYFELHERYPTSSNGPEIILSVSRDDGTNWVNQTLATGTTHTTKTLTGSGSSMRMKAAIRWPARLKGWGFSFQN